jgi:hypothetical protein
VVDAALRGAAGHPDAFDALVELGLGEGLLTPRALWATAAALPHGLPAGRRAGLPAGRGAG